MRRSQRGLFYLIILAAIIFGAWRLREAGHSAPPPQLTGPNRPIRIATWNLMKFSERSRPDLVMIAKIIKEGGFDLLAIQEVQRQGQAVERLRRQLNEPWRHIVSDPAGTGERFALLYRGDVLELMDHPHLLNGSQASIFQRAPFITSLRAGQFDFTLVTVHLSYTDVDRRQREGDALAQLARDLAARGPEKDIIVLGDFNDQRAHGSLQYFDAQGWRRLNRESTNLSSTEAFDNILIDMRFTAEWTGRAGVIRFDEERYSNDDSLARDDVSDHRPVWADFATAGPDDD